MASRRRDWRLPALVAVSAPVGALLAIALFELFMHWRLDLGHRFHDLNTRFDSELGWAAIEGRSLDTPVGRLTSNRHGFRSRELDASAAHVLALGDSVAWGWGVADADSLPWRLDQRWAGAGVQVSNLAVAGYGLDQYLLSFERHAALFPELRAVLAVITTADDLKSSATNTAFGKRKPFFELRAGALVPAAEPIRRYGLRNLMSRSVLLMRLDGSALGPALRALLDPLAGDRRHARAEAEAIGRALFGALAHGARARGAHFAALLVPARTDFPEPGADHLWFAAECARAAWDCLDLRGVLAAAPDPRALYLDDVHLSAAGLARLAEAAAQHLEPALGLARPPD